MAKYVNQLFEKYIPDKDIEESLLVENPVPSNINVVRQLDDFVKSIVHQSNVIPMDSIMEKFQEKLRDVLGPLCKAWDSLEKVKTSNSTEIEVPVEELITLVEKSVLLIGHTSNCISYNRRLNILKVITKDPRKAQSLLKEKADLDYSVLDRAPILFIKSELLCGRFAPLSNS